METTENGRAMQALQTLREHATLEEGLRQSGARGWGRKP